MGAGSRRAPVQTVMCDGIPFKTRNKCFQIGDRNGLRAQWNRKEFQKMKSLLDKIGSLFVYRSPSAKEGYKSGLLKLTNKQLKRIAGTPSNYSKKILVEMILND